MKDPYSILGLERGASENEAKAAFKKLAKTCHPDLHPNDPKAEERFKEINQAYDRICKGDVHEDVNFSNNFSFNDFGGGFGNNPFEHIFGELRRRNQDINIECRITLEEAFVGKELNINVPASEKGSRNVRAHLPAGAIDGMRVRVPKGGLQHNIASPPGDLYINIVVLPHEKFTRNNLDLIIMVPVTVFDILLGKDIEVINIEGKSLKINIPTNFDSARKLRLAGQGMPDYRFSANPSLTRGDLLVELFVQYPALNEEQKKLIQQAIETK
jgi:DnaJ-class molecular chaperone